MKKIAIFGSGAFGREVAMLIEQINAVTPQWELIGFFDDGASREAVNGYPVLGNTEALNHFGEELGITIAIADTAIKRKVHESIKNPRVYYPSLIHPTVVTGIRQSGIGTELVTIGEGAIITAYNVITVNVTIGKFVILNLACTVGHDCILEDYVSVMPGVNISGRVHLQKGVYLGTGVKIINNLTIGENSIVGAGAAVTKTLPANCTAVGVPAKPIKFRKQ